MSWREKHTAAQKQHKRLHGWFGGDQHEGRQLGNPMKTAGHFVNAGGHILEAWGKAMETGGVFLWSEGKALGGVLLTEGVIKLAAHFIPGAAAFDSLNLDVASGVGTFVLEQIPVFRGLRRHIMSIGQSGLKAAQHIDQGFASAGRTTQWTRDTASNVRDTVNQYGPAAVNVARRRLPWPFGQR